MSLPGLKKPKIKCFSLNVFYYEKYYLYHVKQQQYLKVFAVLKAVKKYWIEKVIFFLLK